MSVPTYKPIATMITCREDDENAMVTLGAYRELERENATLREDKERLDCVEKNIVASFGPAQCSDNPHPIHQWIIELPLHETLRAAIDAARKEAQP